MSEKKLSSLKKIGYVRKLPENSDINEYECITITEKDGQKITLYRNLNISKEIDDTTNFSRSWDVFNNHLSN